ncbi:MAG TPA: hypothetical protein VN719_06880 [Gemmatimonadales bacterium]|nr:hypothetical protein [Gemmatimonadales bacterium]
MPSAEALYAPGFDYARWFPAIMKAVVMDLATHTNLPEWYASFLVSNKITDKDVARALVLLCEALTEIHIHPTRRHLGEVMERVGYNRVPVPVRMVIEQLIGMRAIGAWFTVQKSLRDRGATDPTTAGGRGRFSVEEATRAAAMYARKAGLTAQS